MQDEVYTISFCNITYMFFYGKWYIGIDGYRFIYVLNEAYGETSW